MNRLNNPKSEMKIFNNWEVVVKGWYLAYPSRELPQGRAKSIDICGQRVVIFRGLDEKVRALEAYCPHMGTDLGIGQVEGNLIRCFFHHWAFDGDGNCEDIPCQEHIPERAKTPSYATDEKYGFIWIYPDRKASDSVVEFDELKGKQLVTQAEIAFERSCHHHICMMNGIDAQHLQTVHKFDIEMSLFLNQNNSGNVIDFTLTGDFSKKTLRERIGRKIIGHHYSYSMRYADGCMGLLTLMKDVKFLPPLYMIYAYTPVEVGRTRIQPIYVTEKRKGILGWLVAQLLLFLTRMAYYSLRDEDGKVYDNIRFNPKVLLNIDAPVAKYIDYVNQLEPSKWSREV